MRRAAARAAPRAVVAASASPSCVIDRLAPDALRARTPRRTRPRPRASPPTPTCCAAPGHRVERRQRAVARRALDPRAARSSCSTRASCAAPRRAAIGALRPRRRAAGGRRHHRRRRWIEDALGGAPEPRGDGARIVARARPRARDGRRDGGRGPGGGGLGGAGRGACRCSARRASRSPSSRVRGRGRACCWPSSAPLQNRALARADNAAFALAAAGPRDRPVTFLETVHGYGDATGLAALPARVLVDAARAAARRRSRSPGATRAGSGRRRTRSARCRPPRAEYVDALAGALARTRRPAEVARPLREAARERLARRAGPAAATPARTSCAPPARGSGWARTRSARCCARRRTVTGRWPRAARYARLAHGRAAR